jgi:acyl-CoA dehydrogenase
MMNSRIPEELLLVQKTVRDFIRRELMPHEAEIDANDSAPPELLKKLRKHAHELGIYAYNLPTGIGGGGLGLFGQAIVAEEMGRTSVPLAETLGYLPETLRLCDDTQHDLFMRDLVSGEKTVAYALTEPAAGSDLGAATLRATKRGDHWVLRGTKQFISGAAAADYILVLAVTDPEASLRTRFTTFMVRRDAPGFPPPHPVRKMGWKGHDFSILSFDDCMVPEDHIIGEPGGGFSAIMMTINTSRLFVAGKCVGMAQHALALAREWALQRKTFGKILADHQTIQFKLADMDIKVAAARIMLHNAAMAGDQDDPSFRVAVARTKVFATELAGEVIDEALQIFGGMGYSADLPLERLYRDVRAFRLGEGTSEIQRIQIARHVLENGYPNWGPSA